LYSPSYNNVSHTLKDIYTPDQIEVALQKANIKPSVRGEALTIEQFASLSDAFHQIKV